MTTTTTQVTLTDVLLELENWRANKINRSDKMPDAIWEKIIELNKSYPEQAKLTRVLGITKAQLNNKLKEFNDEDLYKEPAHLCQIPKIEAPTESDSGFSALPTIVVEFCRQDGCIMKIHTTTKSINELISGFLGGSNAAINC